MPRVDGYHTLDNPQYSSLPAPNTGNGTAYDQADFDEALCLGHGNATHKPNSDNPVFDPDVFWACTQVDAISCSATARCISSRAASTRARINT